MQNYMIYTRTSKVDETVYTVVHVHVALPQLS